MAGFAWYCAILLSTPLTACVTFYWNWHLVWKYMWASLTRYSNKKKSSVTEKWNNVKQRRQNTFNALLRMCFFFWSKEVLIMKLMLKQTSMGFWCVINLCINSTRQFFLERQKIVVLMIKWWNWITSARQTPIAVEKICSFFSSCC